MYMSRGPSEDVSFSLKVKKKTQLNPVKKYLIQQQKNLNKSWQIP